MSGDQDHATLDWTERVAAATATGESYELEFKSERRDRLPDRELVEAVVCLANGAGGLLLLGVEDDGEVTGAVARHEAGKTDPLRVQAVIAAQTQPPLAVTVHVVELHGHEVLVVEVPKSQRVVGTSRGTYVRRSVLHDGKPGCLPYHAHEMLAHEIDRGAVDWAVLPLPGASVADLDPLEFERVRRLVRTAGDRADHVLGDLSDREIVHALGLGRADSTITAGALLLFGREDALRRFLPTHEVAWQVMRGLDVEVNHCSRLPKTFLPASERGTVRKKSSSVSTASRSRRTPRPPFGKPSPMRSSIGTTPGVPPSTCSGK